MRRFIFSLTQMLALLLAAPALAAEAPPVRPAPSTGMVPAIATCPKLTAEQTADRARTTALKVPAEFRMIARANVNHIAVSTLSGGTVCVSTGYFEAVEGFRLSRDGRFFHFSWGGNEAGGYIIVDRSGRGQSADIGAIPTFSPSRAHFASIEISESGFGSLNAFLVLAVDPVGMRQIAKLETIPMLVDWRIHDWVGETCINLSGIRQEDMPERWEDRSKARRVRYIARAGLRGNWSLTRSTTPCPAR